MQLSLNHIHLHKDSPLHHILYTLMNSPHHHLSATQDNHHTIHPTLTLGAQPGHSLLWPYFIFWAIFYLGCINKGCSHTGCNTTGCNSPDRSNTSSNITCCRIIGYSTTSSSNAGCNTTSCSTADCNKYKP